MLDRPRIGLLFDYDWDKLAHARLEEAHDFERHGFDLFSFPENLRLIGFDLENFAKSLARRARRQSWSGVISHHEHFGALAAALVAEKAGLPGTSPEAILACQHKGYARRVLGEVAPDATLSFATARPGGEIDSGKEPPFPAFVKPIKGVFSVLARAVKTRSDFELHTRFTGRERWVLNRLITPFERVLQRRLPGAGSSLGWVIEEPVPAARQFNLDGFVIGGHLEVLGFVDAWIDAVTGAFTAFETPSRTSPEVRSRAERILARFLRAIGFEHGSVNAEFFYDPITDRLTVIEINPRLASQFGDLYRRVYGVDPHAMALALAQGANPFEVPRSKPESRVAASIVFRTSRLLPAPHAPTPRQVADLERALPGSLLLAFSRSRRSRERDLAWTGTSRYGVLHIGAGNGAELHEKATRAAGILGWTLPSGAQPLREHVLEQST